MKECVTHHFACDCREDRFRKMEAALKEYAKTENWQPWPYSKGYTQSCLDWKLAQEALK